MVVVVATWTGYWLPARRHGVCWPTPKSTCDEDQTMARVTRAQSSCAQSFPRPHEVMPFGGEAGEAGDA